MSVTRLTCFFVPIFENCYSLSPLCIHSFALACVCGGFTG
jgi:hypothetical protein